MSGKKWVALLAGVAWTAVFVIGPAGAFWTFLVGLIAICLTCLLVAIW